MTPTTHHSIFTGWILYLTPNQQCQRTEGRTVIFNNNNRNNITGLRVSTQPLSPSNITRYSTAQLTSNTHTCLTALCPGLPGQASTRKVKPIWILLKQVSKQTYESRGTDRLSILPSPQNVPSLSVDIELRFSLSDSSDSRPWNTRPSSTRSLFRSSSLQSEQGNSRQQTSTPVQYCPLPFLVTHTPV